MAIRVAKTPKVCIGRQVRTIEFVKVGPVMVMYKTDQK